MSRRNEYLSEIDQENAQREAALQRIERLKKEEEELLEKVKKAREEHIEAVQKYEEVLNCPAK